MLIRGTIFFSFFIFQAINFLCAQDTSFYLRGKVIDKETSISIENAIVKICGSYRGTCTDSKGFFSINAKKTGEVIEINAFGYLPYYISTPLLISPENVFRLKRMISNLNETIPQTEKVFSNSSWLLKEFTFWNDKIIFLATNYFSNRDAILSINFSGEIETINFVADKLTGFANTSDGFTAVLGESFAYSLNRTNLEFKIHQTDLTSFEKKYYSSPFKDSTGKYVRYQSGYDYYLSPEAELMVRRSYTTYHVRMKRNNRLALFKNFSDEKFIESSGAWKNAKDITKVKQYLFSRGDIIFHDVPWQIIRGHNQLLFIDRDNLKAEVFDTTGKLIKNVNYKPGLRNGIDHKFIYDEKLHKFYCCDLGEAEVSNSIKPITIISEINFETGEIIKKMELPPNAYPSLMVRSGVFYYLNNLLNNTSQLIKINGGIE